jgi:hypothetical protein
VEGDICKTVIHQVGILKHTRVYIDACNAFID